MASVATAPTAAKSANIAWPSTAASSPAPAAATPAPTSPANGGARCSASGSGTSRSGDGTEFDAVGPRRTMRRHGSRSAATTLPPFRRPTRSEPTAPSPAERTSIRLAPISSAWPGTTGCAGSHGRPSIRTGTRPVSWMKTIEPASSTSRIPWCSSAVASSRRMSADAARPTVCRPGSSGRHEVQHGPATTASSTTAAAAGSRVVPVDSGAVAGSVVIAEPTRRALSTSRHEPTSTAPSMRIDPGIVPSASARSAIVSVAPPGRTRTRRPSTVTSHTAVGSVDVVEVVLTPRSGRSASSQGTNGGAASEIGP